MPRKEQESMSEKLAKEKSWLWDHLTLPRRAQRSNTFIAQTKDAIVKKEFRNIARNGHLTELFKPADSQGKPLEYNNVFDYDLQRNESWNLKNVINPVRMEWDNPLKELDIALRGGPTVAIIDYVFLQNHADTISDYLAAWSQDALLYAYKSTVIVFTSNIALFNQTLRELCYSFTIPASTDGERWEIGRKTIADISAGFQAKYGEPLKEVMTEELVQASRGLNKQQVQTALMMGFFKDRKFKVEHFTELKTDIVKGHGLQYVEPKTGFERIGGYEIYKQYMRERFVAPLRDPERAVKYGIGVPRGIILFGPPGTGKSVITKAIAKELGLPMIVLSSSDVMRGFVGESEQRQRDITTTLDNLAPNVIDAEEVEQLCPDRAKVMMTDSGVSRRITNGWLDWLGQKDRKSLLVGNTNFLRDLDPAFYRPGRIDEIIPIFLPDAAAREAIFEVHTKIERRLPLDETYDAKVLADATWMWNGAEIEQACIDAAHAGFKENMGQVTMSHFMDAIKDHEVNVKAREESLRQIVADLKATQRYNQTFLKLALQAFAQGEQHVEAGTDRVKGLIDSL